MGGARKEGRRRRRERTRHATHHLAQTCWLHPKKKENEL
jgi:hypothetical protein